MKRSKEPRARYSSLFAFAGVVIVFLTFVLKEGISEEFKDSVATLDQAQNIFGVRREIERLRFLIFNVVATSASGLDAAKQLLRFANIGREYVNDDLESMSELLDRVNAGQDLRQRFESYKQDTLQLENDYPELEDELYGRNGKPKKSPDEIMAALERTIPTAKRLNDGELQLERDLINTARERQDKHERYYQRSKWAGWCFYIIGLVLGLVGKVFGLPLAERTD